MLSSASAPGIGSRMLIPTKPSCTFLGLIWKTLENFHGPSSPYSLKHPQQFNQSTFKA